MKRLGYLTLMWHGHEKSKNSIPMLGAQGPFDYITMGGLFTIFKVMEGINNYEDPGWYQHPPGTSAYVASGDDLKRDGISNSSAKKLAASPIPGEAWCAFLPPQNFAQHNKNKTLRSNER